MKFIILVFLLISLSAYAEITTAEDGKCYERKGSMNYIVPCKKETITNPKSETDKTYKKEDRDNCTFKIGKYTLTFLNDNSEIKNEIDLDTRGYTILPYRR